jgi:hypothetical protein
MWLGMYSTSTVGGVLLLVMSLFHVLPYSTLIFILVGLSIVQCDRA